MLLTSKKAKKLKIDLAAFKQQSGFDSHHNKEKIK